MKRIYQTLITQHLSQYRQMAFLMGPRQVGKTTLSKTCIPQGHPFIYLNWDNIKQRELILSGIEEIFQQFQPTLLQTNQKPPIIIFDEIHKYARWKTMLKGYFDSTEDQCKIIVTGSAKLNVYRRGGDSMMGRYFMYRIHPLSVAEILERNNFMEEFTLPKALSQQAWEKLLKFGGFPEPFSAADPIFYQKWMTLKQEQMFREDLRDLSKIHDLARIELLAHVLSKQVTSTTKYSELAKKIQVSEPTVKNWLSVLQNLYYCFSIPPWTKNVSRALLKERKTYLYDWSLIEDPGAKLENLVACHLLKACHFWTDSGLGNYELFYLRDKDQHEVDFLITKNKKPWIMIEVKSSSNGRLTENLLHFNKQLSVPHVFQAALNLPFINEDCFSLKKPMIVPLLTLLSQLV